MKQWRKSSRWRAALKAANPNKIGYYRLELLASGKNPFGGRASTLLLFGRDSSRVSKIIAQNSPYLSAINWADKPWTAQPS